MLKIISFTSAVLIIAMASALFFSYDIFGMLRTRNGNAESSKYAYSMKKDQFTFSENGDVIIFVLDTLDSRIFDRVMNENPEKIDYILNGGYTYFKNTSGTYVKTDPSVVAMLTGKMYYNEIPFFDFTANAFIESKDYYELLKRNNYAINIYATPQYTVPGTMATVFDNYEMHSPSITNIRPFVSSLLRYSIYKCGPFILRPFVFFDISGGFEDSCYDPDFNKNIAYQDDILLRKDYKENGISVDNEHSYFKYYLMEGAHTAYILDENGEYVGEGNSDQYKQTLGAFTILGEIIQGLKDNNLYDKDTIIITADHGSGNSLNEKDVGNIVSNPILLIKRPNCNGQLSESMVPSSSLDIRPTILDILGLEYEKYGTSIYSLNNNSDRLRLFYSYHWVNPRRDGFYLQPITEYIVPEDATNVREYTETGNVYSH